jgi:hypothetical protein
MNSDLINETLEVIASGDAAKALDLVKAWLVAAAGGDLDSQEENAVRDDPDDLDGDNDGSEGDSAEGVPPPAGVRPRTNKPIDPKVVDERRKLTARQIQICREKGIAPETFLAAKRALNPSIERLQRAQSQGEGARMLVPAAFGGDRSDSGTSNAGYRRTR